MITDYTPEPIEEFHSQALKEFHEIAIADHSLFNGEKLKTIDGSQFSELIARFKMRIKKEYKIDLTDNKDYKQ